MDILISIGIDLVLILILAVGIYYPRHRRQDLVLAFLVVNVGVFALTVALGSMALGAGFGIGLFGVLSIIRLRSSEIDQRDVAYYFGSLVLGLVCALITLDNLVIGVLALLVIAILFVADHPRLRRRSVHVQMKLDHAYYDDATLRDALATLLRADITAVKVLQIDSVLDSTAVEVTYRPLQKVAVS